MSRPILMVTGMVRSGTTLISRSLDAHPEMVCAPDPFMGFFRLFRNDLIAAETGGIPDPEAPLSDFFFADEPELALITSADLDLPVSSDVEGLREQMARFAQANVPKLVPRFSELKGRTYSELLSNLLDLVCDVYGDEATRCLGFKQTWAEAFAAPILNTYPQARCVHIVRDPRALIASWKTSNDLTHDYPFLMMIRHWRKSVALANLYARRYENYRVVRYEDFVQGPKSHLERICDFCEVPFSEKTLDVAGFKGGDKGEWRSNTSYAGKAADGISTDYLTRWHERLTEHEISLVETLCLPEMESMGYALETDGGDPELLIGSTDVGRRTKGEVDWINRYSGSYVLDLENLGRELSRLFIYRYHASGASEAFDEETLRRAFIDPGLAGPCRSVDTETS